MSNLQHLLDNVIQRRFKTFILFKFFQSIEQDLHFSSEEKSFESNDSQLRLNRLQQQSSNIIDLKKLLRHPEECFAWLEPKFEEEFDGYVLAKAEYKSITKLSEALKVMRKELRRVRKNLKREQDKLTEIKTLTQKIEDDAQSIVLKTDEQQHAFSAFESAYDSDQRWRDENDEPLTLLYNRLKNLTNDFAFIEILYHDYCKFQKKVLSSDFRPLPKDSNDLDQYLVKLKKQPSIRMGDFITLVQKRAIKGDLDFIEQLSHLTENLVALCKLKQKQRAEQAVLQDLLSDSSKADLEQSISSLSKQKEHLEEKYSALIQDYKQQREAFDETHGAKFKHYYRQLARQTQLDLLKQTILSTIFNHTSDDMQKIYVSKSNSYLQSSDEIRQECNLQLDEVNRLENEYHDLRKKRADYLEKGQQLCNQVEIIENDQQRIKEKLLELRGEEQNPETLWQQAKACLYDFVTCMYLGIYGNKKLQILQEYTQLAQESKANLEQLKDIGHLLDQNRAAINDNLEKKNTNNQKWKALLERNNTTDIVQPGNLKLETAVNESIIKLHEWIEEHRKLNESDTELLALKNKNVQLRRRHLRIAKRR